MKIRENLNKAKKKADKKIKSFFAKYNSKDKTNEQEVKLVGFRLPEVIILVVIATVISALSGSFLTYKLTTDNNDNRVSNSSIYIKEFEEAYKNVIDNYYEDVDKEELIDSAIDGMLSTLDGYTSYMNAEDTEMFNERMNGEYQGIGIEFVTADGYVHTVTGVFENTPAFVAGVQKGDIILRVDNIDAATKTGTQLASYIKSTNISEITMIVRRNNKEVTLKIKKSVISIPSVTKKTFNINDKKVGYIDISLFADNTYSQFNEALKSLENEGITSLVVDVRNNSGGYLHAADDILELFLSKGNVMYQMQDKARTVKYEDQTNEKRTYPVAVLINGNSASASEILAAALKEVYDAQIIGTTSYGKGTVQQPNNLSNGGMIKVTTDRWLTPDGNCVDKVGLKPTTEIKMDDSYSTNPTDQNDTQLQKALELVSTK